MRLHRYLGTGPLSLNPDVHVLRQHRVYLNGTRAQEACMVSMSCDIQCDGLHGPFMQKPRSPVGNESWGRYLERQPAGLSGGDGEEKAGSVFPSGFTAGTRSAALLAGREARKELGISNLPGHSQRCLSFQQEPSTGAAGCGPRGSCVHSAGRSCGAPRIKGPAQRAVAGTWRKSGSQPQGRGH